MNGRSLRRVRVGRISAAHEEGNPSLDRTYVRYNACRSEFGFSKSDWYAATAAGRILAKVERRGRRGNPRYAWRAIEAWYDEGNSYADGRRRFGFSPAAWTKAVRSGKLRARARAWSLDKVLAFAKTRKTVKMRLIEAGILRNACEESGISEWQGKPLSIQLDHRNGRRNDHRLENLRTLRPNCHSQTPTFGARNRGKHPDISFLFIDYVLPSRQAVRQPALTRSFGGSNPSSGTWPYRLEA